MRKLLTISLLCSAALFGQEIDNQTSQNNDVIERFMRLSSEQLYDTANHYFSKNSYDTALICYDLLIKEIPKSGDVEQQTIIVDVYNRIAAIYASFSDYRVAYDYLINMLIICEKHNITTKLSRAYTNIGIVYSYLNQYHTAKQYYLKALDLCSDSVAIINLLNNLGALEMHNNKNETVNRSNSSRSICKHSCYRDLRVSKHG